MIDPNEPFGDLLTHVLHILPVVLVFAVPVALLGGVVLYWLRKGSLASALTARAGMNGRIPTANARPIPWNMSKARCNVLYREEA